jgi:CubicO group peptidase (beta-lactamase class C family)
MWRQTARVEGTATEVEVLGRCDSRFEAVREAFGENFRDGGEVGGAVCVIVDGRVVVDCWGGHADGARTRPWREDTLVNVFSVGKGLAALVVAQLVERGLLDVDATVASVWPEFAQAGKGDITLRQLLSHQAGLPAVRRRLPPAAMFDWGLMVDALAAETPWWLPGTAHGYHTNTFGFLVGEVMRRATGQSPGTRLRDAVVRPLDVDVRLGLPATEHHRVAELLWPGEPPPEEQPADLDDPDELMRYNTYFNPSGLSGAGVVNTPAWRQAEMPSTNTHATARGIAQVYEVLAAGGSTRTVRLVGADVLAEFTTEQVYGEDRVLQRPSRFGLGFQLTQPERLLGPNPGAFGHFGAGGSLGYCDPESGVAFGYVTNQLDSRWRTPRNRALLDALYSSLS